MLEVGKKALGQMDVTEDLTAERMGSGSLAVLATPAVLALVEETAWRSVADDLDEGACTVGTAVSLDHLAATPLGMVALCETTLEAVEGRKLCFSFEVRDAEGIIASGRHERFVVQTEKFMAKAEAKRQTFEAQMLKARQESLSGDFSFDDEDY